MNRKNLREFKKYRSMTGYKIVLQPVPLWLIAMRILNFKFFKKRYLDFIEPPRMRDFFVTELQKMGYVKQISRGVLNSKKKRMNRNYAVIKDFDAECFYHFWFIEVFLIVEARDAIIARARQLEYVKRAKNVQHFYLRP